MARVQLNRLQTVLGVGITMAAVAFTMLRKVNDFSVTAAVTGSGGGAALDICDDSGKIRVFRDMDDFVKAASKLGLINSLSALEISVTNPGAFEPPVYTGDIVAKTRRDVAGFEANVTRLTASEVSLTAQVALLANVTPAEQAYRAEKVAQLAAITAQKTWLQSEIVRLNALLPPV